MGSRSRRTESDADGRPIRAAGILIDVTARKQAEMALAESEARLRLSQEAANIASFVQEFPDPTLRFTPGALIMLGFPPDQDTMSRELAHSIFHPEDFRMFRRDASQTWLRQQFIVTERDPVTGGARRLLGLTRDVTQVRDMQAVLERLVEERTRELRDTQRRLAHIERMQALGQLAGGIAHDINNVLQAVQGGSALLARRCGNPDEVRHLANLILTATERGAGVTSRLLAFSRQADLLTVPVDVALLLQGMKDILTHALGSGIEVGIEAPEGLPPLVADKAQLETALVNLATNARDAMGCMGTLTLAAAEEIHERKTSSGHDLEPEPGRYVRLSVTDTGTGMDPVTLGRATEPFYTTKPHMWTAPALQDVLQCLDQIACVHMSGLLMRSHMNAGQDGFRDTSSKQQSDL